MPLRVTFITDEYDDQPDRIFDVVMRIGGWDVDMEEVEPEEKRPTTARKRKEPTTAPKRKEVDR